MHRSNVLGVLVVLFIFSLGIYFFQNKSKSGHSDGLINDLSGSISKNSNITHSGAISVASGELFPKMTDDQLMKECESVIDGKQSQFLQQYAPELVNRYQKMHDVFYDDNEYLDFINVLNGNCSVFSGRKYLFCRAYKARDVSKLDSQDIYSYDYVLLKSMIDDMNYSNELSDLRMQHDCDLNFRSIQKIRSLSGEVNIFSGTHIDRSYMLSKVGETRYKEILNQEFRKECMLLGQKHK